VCGFDSHSGY